MPEDFLKKASPNGTASSESVQPEPADDGAEILPVSTADPPSVDLQSSTESVVGVTSETEARPGERREIVRFAGLVMLGNLGSSIMGMVRQIFVASTGSLISAAFQSALLPAQTFYDFMVNGSVPGALIPTFNDYAAPEKRNELRRLVFTIVNLVLLVMLVVSLLFILISPWFVTTILVPGYTAAGKELTLQFARIIFFSLIMLGPFAVLLAALYALKEFGWPAFATVSYHCGIILGAIVGGLLGTRYFGQYGLAFGVLVGAVGEVALLIPGMRNQHFAYMFVLDLKHPALGRILKLYAPVALSFLVSMMLVFLDQHLASGTPCMSFMQGAQKCGEANFAAMRFATTLVQFPIGLVAAALSFAVLPALSTYAREGENERFKDTLLLGFRLGLLLMIPAAAGLIVLQTPIVRAVFEHGKFSSQDAQLAAIALQNYAYQLPFVAMDQLLIAAFYARKNTIVPVVVGFASVLCYLLVALPFWQTVGMPALVLANTVQNSSHAVILLVILRVAIGPMHLGKLASVLVKIVAVTAVMIIVAWGLQVVLASIPLFGLDRLLGRLLTVIVVGGVAVALYFGGTTLLKVEEVKLLKGVVLSKLGRK